MGHADSIWPYISDTGTMPPESCIFGQLLNIGAFLLSVIFYIKYKQVADFYRSHTDKKMLKRINNVSLIIGLIGALGVRQVSTGKVNS